MSDPYIGEIRMFAGNFAPNGWLFCQGQLLPISQYEALFTLIGTSYGGDGQNTFGLPNLASRIPVHQRSGYPVGFIGGAETVTLVPNGLPVHNHAALGSSAAGTSPAPNGAFWATGTTAEYSSAAPDVTMSPAALTAAGGSQPHDNMPPFLAVNFIISLFGIYPPQS